MTVDLHEYVASGNAEIGGTELHIGRHVRGADNDDLGAGDVGVDNEFAALERILHGLDPGARQQRQTLFQNPPLGQRNFYALSHGSGNIADSGATSVGHAPDARAELLELLLDALVAAIDVIDAIDERLALGPQAGHHKTS